MLMMMMTTMAPLRMPLLLLIAEGENRSSSITSSSVAI